MNALNSPISTLTGVGKTRASQLEKLGICTLKDLIYHFPRAYENRGNVVMLSEASESSSSAMLLTVKTQPSSRLIRRGLTITKFKAFDTSGTAELVFFNMPYVKDVFKIGAEYRFYGKVIYDKGHIKLQNPKYEPYVEGMELNDFVPVYPLTEGISSKILEKLVKLALDRTVTEITDPLPESIRLTEGMPTLAFALKNAHFPESPAALSASLRRLAFDEMFLFGLAISITNKHKTDCDGLPFSPKRIDSFTSLLPYELTDSQKSAINEIYRDTVIKNSDGKISPMARILVGDVGSGKTVCAEAAIYFAVTSAYQAALMVPTEILARQHFTEISERFEKLGYKTELLIGSMTPKQKFGVYQRLKSGECDIVVGTHAIISDKVEFSNLGLVITDEQHRFGVNQRAVLKEKGKRAHMLVMSATPIPRTLALTMYGDLDITKITQMPKGRKRVDTFVVDEEYRTRLNAFINKQVSIGGQCYIVCPTIEKETENDTLVPIGADSDAMISENSLNLKNAVEYAEDLAKVLPNIKVECLHGRMKASEKDEIMKRFSEGEINVLVSTTVIEVGVNVPGATLMIVENAERFGLSQLHQLRGRVGRGEKKSYCVLVSDFKTGTAAERLNVMKTTYDGFEIAEKDLLLRGPGDFFSSNSASNLRQSGGFDFKFASTCNSTDIMERAFGAAKAVISSDPGLTRPEHSELLILCKDILKSSNSNIS